MKKEIYKKSYLRQMESKQLLETNKGKFDRDTFVLIIDDDVAFVAFVKELLEPLGAKVIIALDGTRGIEKFYSMRPSFVFIDVSLPDMTGFELLSRIREPARVRHTGVIMMSTDGSKENRVATYENGALDFLEKPFDIDTFLVYLFNRNALQKTIKQSIMMDSLTGVGNRRFFDEKIYDFVETAKRKGTPLSLVMIDIDHFKHVNDTYGHPAGDEVLRKLGEVSLNVKRDSDYVFRYGGEEFAFLLDGVTAEEAAVLIERVRQEFNGFVFVEKGESFSVTFSSGIATYAQGISQLISAADQALYEAKRHGRNQTNIYNIDVEVVKRKLTIIIVDDDVLIRTMLYDELMTWQSPDLDISVEVYPDGVSFLEADWYNPEVAYVILLDGVMPGLDGLDVLQRLKSDYDKKNILVSMLTARKKAADMKAAFGLGAADYIMKPFNPSAALLRIQQLASRLFT